MGWSKNYYCLSIKLRIRLSFGNPSIIYGWNFSDWMYNIVIIRRITIIRDLFRYNYWAELQIHICLFIYFILCVEQGERAMRVCMLSSLHPWDPSISSVPQRLRNPMLLCLVACVPELRRYGEIVHFSGFSWAL